MTVKVKADCYITSSQMENTSEVFCNIVQFLTSSDAAQLGIKTVELNRGLGGRGFNYTDTFDQVGPRAWGCFRFLSSSYGQFDIVLSYTTASISSLPFNISTANSDPTYGLIGLSVAAHVSGSVTVPWNGSSGSFTSGTIGSPVFKTDSSGRLATWPRQNAPGGAFATGKQYQVKISPATSFATRQHIILTEDSFTMLMDAGNSPGNYKVVHFGPVSPRSGVLLDVPYFMFVRDSYGGSPVFYTTTVGGTAGNSSPDSEGGFPTPTLNSTNGTKTCTFYGIGQNQTQTAHDYLNTFMSSSYEVFPYYIGIKDGTDTGMLGTVVNVSLCYGSPAPTVSPSSSSLVIGSNVILSQKFVFPWAGPSPGYISNSRSGRIETGT